MLKQLFFYKIVSCCLTFIWITIGILTAGSIVLNSKSWFTNFTMSFLFMIVGIISYIRMKYLTKTSSTADYFNNNKTTRTNFYQFLITEIILISIITVLSLGILYGVFTRVFISHYTVFD